MTNTIAPSTVRVLPQDRSSRVITVIILLLAYSATVQYVVGPALESLVAQNAQNNQFNDTATLLTVMRVGVVFWVFLVSFLQALSLRLIYKGIVRGPAPSLGTSWCWALAGQLPFILTGLSLMLLADGRGIGALGHMGLRIVFGAAAAAIYCALARYAFRPSGARLTIYFFVVTVVNSVLLVAVAAS
ncbi:MAG: hypothetical protein Q4C90_01825 [Kocuria sp.]|uniref:hypothetical protein n=1 Tax=Kocuria TaxID=57493 RepID=UPI0026DB06E8|nr:hypothetical protein [Kocuria sp.]MDO4255900.1 hypothetical protein [Kocuria sp.]